MLESLEIRNFRCLKNLKIPSLKRINLFTGKNNTGKSTILEAIALYTTKGHLSLISQLLTERGENVRQYEKNHHHIENNLKVFSSLFTDRNCGFDPMDAISIGEVKNETSEEDSPSHKSITLNFVKYVDVREKEDQGFVLRRKRFSVQNNEKRIEEGYKLGFELGIGNDSVIFPLNFHIFSEYYPRLDAMNVQYVRGRNIDNENNSRLFDNITLTNKEQHVIDALKIIEPATEKIAFVEEDTRGRRAVIKLSNSQNVLPLKSMGDGINRILTMILALVNSENGFLLIDEFENGLHYTIQEQLWKIIFLMSRKLNIQVFATTHSEDSIRGFESVLNSSDYSPLGKLVRLDNKNGTIVPVEYDAKELEITNRNDIEIR
ncbi:MAG: ATP-binding protein [Planctomycetaceae bacterium]|jgi:AAA15 family ATPase/GTPase|nr:ATP-binding protein [Planctomycetaceae bacterium]